MIKLIRATLYHQFQPFRDGPYQCRGQAEDGFDSTIVRLETDTGVVGWGEMAPLGSFYSAAFASGTRAGLTELLPKLLGQDPCQIERINHFMDETLLGHPYIKAPIDMACWDILGQVAGMPLAELTGGRYGQSVPLYRSVSQASPDEMAKTAQKYIEQGYQHIQVKVGDDPLEDIERMRAVRAVVPPHVLLLADANGGWRVDAALRFVQAMGDTDYFLEQPCMTLTECAQVRPHLSQPMILDESIETLDDLIQSHTAQTLNGVTIKLSRVGGITKAKLIRDVAIALGLRVTIEDTGGSDINTAATTHLMLSTPRAIRFHTVDFMNWVTVSNATGMPPVTGGRIRAPVEPGLGVAILEGVLGEPIFECEQARSLNVLS